MTYLWSKVVGQDDAIDRLTRFAHSPTHAYLFIGPPGCTKDEAARAFGALLIDPRLDPHDTTSRTARLAIAGEHPDIIEVRRVGARINKDQAKDVIRRANLTPTEGSAKVLVLHEFHLLDPEAAGRLLKTIEEPPDSTYFIVLADQLPPELVTIASRCVHIDFRAVSTDLITSVLREEGHDHETAELAAGSAGGDLSRARLLAGDPQLTLRRHAFASIPARLDDTGRTVCAIADELLGLIDAAAEPLLARQARELEDLEARVELAGERGSGRKDLVDRHKRELRRHRTDELRFGLTATAAAYRDALVDGSVRRPVEALGAIDALHTAMAALDRNPNELLLLQQLLLGLPTLAA